MGRHNKSFVENFWVEDINSTAGFDVLSNRMRDGRKLCKEIDDYLRQRSKIEAQYAKELQKLNKQDNKEDLGGLEMAWKEMKQQTERIAHHHDVAAKHFLNIANEISIFNTEQKKVTKEWEDKVSKLHSAAKNTYAKVNNQYKVYDNKFNENSAADAALKYNEKHSDGITPKEMEKTRTKADKARDELEKTDTLYKTLVKQVQEEMSTWEKEMSGLCKKFQDLDEQRIDHLRDYLWKCTNIDSQANARLVGIGKCTNKDSQSNVDHDQANVIMISRYRKCTNIDSQANVDHDQVNVDGRYRIIDSDDQVYRKCTNKDSQVNVDHDQVVGSKHRLSGRYRKCTNIDSQANVDHDQVGIGSVQTQTQVNVDHDQCCENVRVVLEKCNIDNDIDHFITKHKTGNRHPARVEYKGHSKVPTPVLIFMMMSVREKKTDLL
ncbi:PSTPIP1 [Mytilus coruscus]|uniref:PSTPIP1 n=1 Tax=Mytilus coruscus TaxID=42192 RepID=A0A6J8A6L2_MYTCO|nr:PSTPIP1 [Mytilus coruscus]